MSQSTAALTSFAQLERRGWNREEARLIRKWISRGHTLEDVEEMLRQDYDDAAEEDGYDGP